MKDFIKKFILTVLGFSLLSSFCASSQLYILSTEELNTQVKEYKLEHLFSRHQLCDTQIKYAYVQHAYAQALILLDNEKGEEALPYLIYAENHYYMPSLVTLNEIALNSYKNILPLSQEKIRNFLLSPEIQEFIIHYYNMSKKSEKLIQQEGKFIPGVLARNGWGNFLSSFQKTSPKFTGISAHDRRIEESIPPLTLKNFKSTTSLMNIHSKLKKE